RLQASVARDRPAHLRSLACRHAPVPARWLRRYRPRGRTSDRSDPWQRCPELLLGNWPFDGDLPQESAGAGSRNAAPRIMHAAPFHDVGDGVLAEAQLSPDQPIAPAGVDQGEDLGGQAIGFWTLAKLPSEHLASRLRSGETRSPELRRFTSGFALSEEPTPK